MNTVISELADAITVEFQDQYDCGPDWIVAAPGRVNLMGEHIDYNDGWVLPMAIERYVLMAASCRASNTEPSQPNTIQVYSRQLEESESIELVTKHRSKQCGWISYIEGVVAGFLEMGNDISPLNILVKSNIPLGSGLSSSAALEVATATLLEEVTETHLDPIAKTLLCQRAEHDFIGVPCGIMDQFSSVFGLEDQLILLDCQSQMWKPIPFSNNSLSILICNSNVNHALADGEYAARREQSDQALQKLRVVSWREVSEENLRSQHTLLTETEYRRATHVVTEIARTLETAAVIQQEDWSALGTLMRQSHRSLQKNYEVSCRELDILVEIAEEIGEQGGMIGSRMTGGGFGGCTVSFVRTNQLEQIQETLRVQYESRTGIQLDCFACRPARGAHLVRKSK